ncbi:MAG: CHAP domain-containing protein [Propionibacteriaceae bacterium]|nr:CHAP domain-containing protein [Propionibacteriaceae bacterium]
MADDRPRRWRDIRVVSRAGWRHNGLEAARPRYGGTITTTTKTVNGKTETWVSETLSTRQQITSAVRQAGHVAWTQSVSGAATVGRVGARTTSRAARTVRAQLRKLEAAGELDVDAQLSMAGRAAARTTGRATKRVAAGVGRQVLKKIGIEKKPHSGLTGSVRRAGSGLMHQVRGGVGLMADGGQLDVDRAAARMTQRAWNKSVGVTGRAAARGARVTTRWAARHTGKATRWVAARTAALAVKAGMAVAHLIGALAGAVGTILPVLLIVIGIVAVLCAILPSFITGAGAENQRREEAARRSQLTSCSGPGVVSAADVAVFLPSPRGTDISGSLSEEQRATATAIVEEGQKAGIPPRGWAVALMTAMQESTMGANPATKQPNGDGDVGVFQQRAKLGWYADGATMAENTRILNDVRYAAKTFFLGHKVGVFSPSGAGSLGYQIPGLVNISGWESMDLGKAAQKVQVSAFPDYYAKHEATVASLLPTLNPQGCSQVDLLVPGASGLAGKDDYAGWYAKLPDMVKAEGYDPNGFAWRQCTSYAGFAVRTYSRHKDFNNWWRQDGGRFSDAKHWHVAARKAGIRVDQTPAVGAVAQRTSGDWGHVAYVVAVNDDGSFVINEYNHVTTREFSSRTARIGNGSHDFTNFLHFEE